MGKRVKIRTLVALAGPTMSLAAGDIWEVDEAVAAERIKLGLAEPVEPPAKRQAVQRAGVKAETAALKKPATRSKPD